MGGEMNLKSFTDGVAILLPYYTNHNKYHLGAEHDQIYLYKTDLPLSEEDQKKMCDLGWFQSDCGLSSDGGEYDPEDGWRAFV
jgi:hypothetical protein